MGTRFDLERWFERLAKNAKAGVVTGMALMTGSALTPAPYDMGLTCSGLIWIGVSTLLFVTFALHRLVKGMRCLGGDRA